MKIETFDGIPYVSIGVGNPNINLMDKYGIKKEDIYNYTIGVRMMNDYKGDNDSHEYYVLKSFYYDNINKFEKTPKPLKVGDTIRIPTDFVYVGNSETSNIDSIKDECKVWTIEEGEAVEASCVYKNRDFYVIFDDFFGVSHLIRKPTIHLPPSILSEEGEFIFIGLGNREIPLLVKYNISPYQIYKNTNRGFTHGHRGNDEDVSHYVRRQFYIDNIEKFQQETL